LLLSTYAIYREINSQIFYKATNCIIKYNGKVILRSIIINKNVDDAYLYATSRDNMDNMSNCLSCSTLFKSFTPA